MISPPNKQKHLNRDREQALDPPSSTLIHHLAQSGDEGESDDEPTEESTDEQEDAHDFLDLSVKSTWLVTSAFQRIHN